MEIITTINKGYVSPTFHWTKSCFLRLVRARNHAVVLLFSGHRGFSLSTGSNTELIAGDSDRNLDSPGAYSLRWEETRPADRHASELLTV